MLLGIVSDTHGLLRPEVAPALRGVERILHLGDVGKISILEELAKIAPVTAIRGNIDRDGPCARLPETEVVLIESSAANKRPGPGPNSAHAGIYLYMLHNLKALHLDPGAAKFAAVLHGHTHVPDVTTKKGVLYFNPGSCGPRRFELPVTLGLLTIRAKGELNAEVIHLEAGKTGATLVKRPKR
jgi:uncharacterized protein